MILILGARFSSFFAELSQSPGRGLISCTSFACSFGLCIDFLAQLLKANADETMHRNGEIDKHTSRKENSRGRQLESFCGVKSNGCAVPLVVLFASLPLVSGEAVGPTNEEDSTSGSSSAPSFTIFVVTILIVVNVSSLLIGRARKSLGLEFLPYTLLVYSVGIALGFLETLLKASAPEEGGDDADAFSSKHWEGRTTPVLSFFR